MKEAADHRWLPLLLHCADVAAALAVLLDVPVLRARALALGLRVDPVGIERLLALAFLHDAGKALPGFQDKVFAPTRAAGADSDHVRPMVGLLLDQPGRLSEQVHAALVMDAAGSWFGGDEGRDTMLIAALGHHGGLPDIVSTMTAAATVATACRRRGRYSPPPMETWKEMGAAVHSLFPSAFADSSGPHPETVAVQWFSGLLMLADWLGSDAVCCPVYAVGEAIPTLSERYEASKAGVRARLRAMGFSASALAREAGWTMTAPVDRDGASQRALCAKAIPGLSPRPAQQAVLGVPTSHRVVLLEAPTGDGKTEAAILRFLVLLFAGEVDSLYFAVPTRSAGFELSTRVAEIAGRVAPDLARLTVLAVGGAPNPTGAVASAEDENAGRDLHEEAAEERIPWTMGNMKRRMAAPIAVGTIDQAYLSATRGKHGLLRSSLLSRSLLVIDEAHAADPFMMRITSSLVERQIRQGGHILLMSATLGSYGVARIAAGDTGVVDLPSLEQAVARPYPSITHGETRLEHSVDLSAPTSGQTPKTIQTRRLRPSDLVDTVKAAVAAHARVLLIRSTVRDAVADQRALEAAGLPTLTVDVEGRAVPTLHHGRFAGADRAGLNAAIIKAIGKVRARDRPRDRARDRGERRGIVVVTTQTAEQSLDLDADLLITDPCPADVLLQRLGRLFRHDRDRPRGFETAQALILDPGTLADFIGRSADHPTVGRPGFGFAFVYENLLSIAATLNWLDARSGIVRTPVDCRSVVENATHGNALRDLARRLDDADGGHRWSDLWAWTYGKNAVRSGEAARMLMPPDGDVLDTPNLFCLLPDAEIRTRLGDDRVDIRYVPFTSPFGNRIDSLSLNHKKLEPALLAGFDPKTMQAPTTPTMIEGETVTLIDVKGVRFVYGRHGWISAGVTC